MLIDSDMETFMKHIDRNQLYNELHRQMGSNPHNNPVEFLLRLIAKKCQESDDGTLHINIWFIGDFFIRYKPAKRKAEAEK